MKKEKQKKEIAVGGGGGAGGEHYTGRNPLKCNKIINFLSAKELNPPPSYIADRLVLWDIFKAKADAELAAKTRETITITLPDGRVVPGTSWETSPYAVAAGISQGLADATIVAKINGVLWDLDRPLEEDCTLQLIKFDDAEGKEVFWHSTAHCLGESMERIFGGHLCYGPPIESGFYYDMFMEGDGVSKGRCWWVSGFDAIVARTLSLSLCVDFDQ